MIAGGREGGRQLHRPPVCSGGSSNAELNIWNWMFIPSFSAATAKRGQPQWTWPAAAHGRCDDSGDVGGGSGAFSIDDPNLIEHNASSQPVHFWLKFTAYTIGKHSIRFLLPHFSLFLLYLLVHPKIAQTQNLTFPWSKLGNNNKCPALQNYEHNGLLFIPFLSAFSLIHQSNVFTFHWIQSNEFTDFAINSSRTENTAKQSQKLMR